MKNKKVKGILELMFFAGPALFSVVMITIIPFLMNIYFSVFDWNGISKDMEFVGLSNFIRIFTRDAQFKSSFLFTIQFSVIYIVAVNLFAILIANYLSDSHLMANVTRAFYFLPYIISLVAISLIWRFLLGPGFTYLYEWTGIELFGISWLGDPGYAMISIILVSVWQNMGFFMIIYIAGFMAIPKSLLEASSIDGATKFKRFLKVKLPLLMPSITICIFYSLTFGLKLFDIILVLTKGGPGNATRTVAYDIYNDAFLSNRYGLATAKSLVFFAVVLIVTVLQLRYFKNMEVEY